MADAKRKPDLDQNDEPLPRYTREHTEWIFHHPKFMIAVKNLPHSEVKYTQDLYRSVNPEGGPMEIDEYKQRVLLTHNRWSNAICYACHRKGPNCLLRRCGACQLVLYCDEKCQSQDWEKHKSWCCNLDAPIPDKCPYTPVLIKVPPTTKAKPGDIGYLSTA